MFSRKIVVCIASFITLVVTSGCQREAYVQHQFNREVSQRMENTAQEYPNDAYQSGQVPLKSYIKISGKITKTDAKDGSQIGKSDRFVIESAGFSYQVINSTDTLVALADEVVVYGEYQGFIQGETVQVID